MTKVESVKKTLLFSSTVLFFSLLPVQLWGQSRGVSSQPLEDLRMVEGDEQGNEIKALKTELLVSSTEQKAVEQAQKLVQKYRGTAMEPDLWFRLAELYMRRARTDRFFEIHRQSETVVSLAPRVVKEASSRRNIREAVNIYDRIQRQFPDFAQMDQVMFNNAFARQGLAEDHQAEKLYSGLIARFPGSSLVPDAHLAIGEINFDRRQFKQALVHFQAIEAYPESRVYPYGLYKSAWSLYNMAQNRAAIDKLEEVVAYGKKIAQRQAGSRLDLRNEALADMTLFFAEVYPAKDAYRYFKKQSGELDVSPYLLRMAKLYERHSRHEDMYIVLSDFIKQEPTSPLAVEFHNEMVLNFENMKQKDKAVVAMESFYKLCEGNTRWVRAQKAALEKGEPAGSVEECHQTLSATSLRLAGRWLKVWRSNQRHVEFAEAAEQAFVIYLRRSAEDKEAEEARFAYAELLFQREKFREASHQYALVNPSGGQTQLAHDASYAALVSLQKAVGEKWSDRDEQSFHELAKIYVQNHPKGEFVLDVEFKMAMIAYEKERYTEAGPIFMRLGAEYPKEERGLKAQDLYMDILNINKDYKGLVEYSHSLLSTPLSGERKAQLQAIYEQAYFLRIQDLEEKGQHQEAIVSYKKFANENLQSPLAEKAWWNAVQLHFTSHDHAGGAIAAEEFYSKFPKSKHAVDSLLRAAQTYESMGQLAQAARVISLLAEVDLKSQVKWQVLAADFYWLSGQEVRARGLYNQLKSSPDLKVRTHALEKLNFMAKNAGGNRIQVLREIVQRADQPLAGLALAEIVEHLYEEKKTTEAFAEARKLVGMNQATPAARARGRFVQARILEDEFVSQSVRSRADRVALVLGLKTEKLEKAQSAYQATIRFGDPYTSVAALKRLAECYSHYVEALNTMPLPQGLGIEDEAVFRAEMQRLSIPLEEKGVETLAQALETAKKMQLRDGSVERLQRELYRANMVESQKIQLDVEAPGWVAPVFAGVGS